MRFENFSRFALSFLAILAGESMAADLIVNAPVVAAEPVEEVSERYSCRAEMPPSDDLVALLQWDLCLPPYRDVQRETDIKGYRVTYRWDGRTFQQLMDEPPGDAIPIRVRMD